MTYDVCVNRKKRRVIGGREH